MTRTRSRTRKQSARHAPDDGIGQRHEDTIDFVMTWTDLVVSLRAVRAHAARLAALTQKVRGANDRPAGKGSRVSFDGLACQAALVKLAAEGALGVIEGKAPKFITMFANNAEKLAA